MMSRSLTATIFPSGYAIHVYPRSTACDTGFQIDNNRGCPVGSCPVDLGPNCPSALKGPFDSSGFPVGCKSACEALGGENNCCTGSHNTAATCPPSGVTDYSYFSMLPYRDPTRGMSANNVAENNCPDSYVYAYDGKHLHLMLS